MGEFISSELYQAALDSFNRTVLINGIIVLTTFVLGFLLSKWSLEKTEKLPKDSGKVDIAKIINIRWSGAVGTAMIMAGILVSVMTMQAKPVYSVTSKDGGTFKLSINTTIEDTNKRIKKLETVLSSYNRWAVVSSSRLENVTVKAMMRAIADDDQLVRMNAVSALGSIGSPAKVALPDLEKRLEVSIGLENENMNLSEKENQSTETLIIGSLKRCCKE